MKHRMGVYAVVGVLFGSIFGVFLGEALGHGGFGVAVGALCGLYLGWFAAAAVLEGGNKKKTSAFELKNGEKR